MPQQALATKIVDKMTTDLDLRLYHDGYKERIEALITSKMKGEVVQVKEEKPKKPAGDAEGYSRIFEVNIGDYHV